MRDNYIYKYISYIPTVYIGNLMANGNYSGAVLFYLYCYLLIFFKYLFSRLNIILIGKYLYNNK